MNGPGDDFFAGTCFAGDQDRDFPVLHDPFHQVDHLAERRAGANDPAEIGNKLRICKYLMTAISTLRESNQQDTKWKLICQ